MTEPTQHPDVMWESDKGTQKPIHCPMLGLIDGFRNRRAYKITPCFTAWNDAPTPDNHSPEWRCYGVAASPHSFEIEIPNGGLLFGLDVGEQGQYQWRIDYCPWCGGKIHTWQDEDSEWHWGGCRKVDG